MNESTAALLTLFQTDRLAPGGPQCFYHDRHSEAYVAGRWEAPIGPFDTYLADFETPDCPEGWDTYRGYLARTEPLTLSLMDSFAETDDGEEAVISTLCRLSGMEPLLVSAPAWLARKGVFQALAFPVPVLKEYTETETGT